MIQENTYKWLSNVGEGFEFARVNNKPLFLFFCSETCFFCHRTDMVVYSRQNVADLIQSEFIHVRLKPERPDVFRSFTVNKVPAFIVTDADGLECERCSGFHEAEALAAFCLIALGKFYYACHKIEKAQIYLERLISSYSRSIYAPEAVFLLGIYRYLTTHDPAHLKTSLFSLAKNYPDSIWVRRSLVLQCHPSTVTEWDIYQRQHRDYWKSQDAYLKAYFTYYNGPSDHHLKET